MPAVISLFQRAAVLAALVLVASCGSNDDDAPKEAPTGFTVVAGDTSVVATWDTVPGYTYWIFSAAADSITRDNYNRFPGARITQQATSPQLISGLTNGTTYSFLINATQDGSPAGPSSESVSAVPRPAADTWTVGTPLTTATLNAVGLGAALYVAVGDGGAVFTRPVTVDGDWTAQTSGVTANLRGVTGSAATAAVAVGDGGTIIVSSDGATWTAATSGVSADLNDIALGNGAYVVVGDGGLILRSTDRETWTAIDSGTTVDFVGVAIVNSIFLAFGSDGSMLSSADYGLTWTARSTGVSTALRSATYTSTSSNVQQYVAVGDGGVVLTSTDLETWTAGTSNITQSLRRVAYGTRVVAVGAGGTIIYSDDEGATWTAAASGTTADLRGLLRGSLLEYLAVGEAGANLISR